MNQNERMKLSRELRKLRSKEAHWDGQYRAARIHLREIRDRIAVVLEDLGDDA